MAAAAHKLVWRFSSFPVVKVEQRPPLTASLYSTTRQSAMPLSRKSITAAAAAVADDTHTPTTRKLPILLFDIMDTVVRDPFYHDIPAFFGMSMKELLECKHPTAWTEFEKGLIDEVELAQKFFEDGRPLDLEGLKSCMRRGYAYLEGVENLLIDLKNNGYEMHTATNYPICNNCQKNERLGKRKPDPDFYMDMLMHLKVEPGCCIFIDDRMRNVEAARHAGLIGIQFNTADSLRKDLSHLGISLQTETHKFQ